MKKITIGTLLGCMSTSLYSSKITVWNNTFSPIKTTINYGKEKTHTLEIESASHNSWDNIAYNIKSITIKNKALKLSKGITKKFDVYYNGKEVALGKGVSPELTFITPDSSLRYDQVTFLGAHNAHSAHAYGYAYAQQDKKIEEQLKSGVRLLLLDTFPVKRSNLLKKAEPSRTELKKDAALKNYTVMLWHGPIGKRLKFSFVDALKKVKEFLEKNKNEIVTIHLENYAPSKLIEKAIEEANITTFVLKPEDWDPQAKSSWPTLEWMVKHNKRLVFFDDYKSKYCYNYWTHIATNQYGTTNINKASKLRENLIELPYRMKNTSLLSLTLVGKITNPLAYPKTNSSKLRELVELVYKEGLGGHEAGKKLKGKNPNFIALDYVTRGKDGDPLKLINELNHKASIKKQTRKK